MQLTFLSNRTEYLQKHSGFTLVGIRDVKRNARHDANTY